MTERQDPQDKLPRQMAATYLARAKVRIIKSWEEHVRHSLPAAAAQRRPALLDSLPEFLDRLIQALREPAPEPSCEVASVSREHARDRANLADYTIDQVIREYHHLRECILAVLEPAYTLSPSERAIIHRTIDEGIAESAAEYARIHSTLESVARAEAELAAKRLGKIQLITETALAGSIDLDRLLKDLLTLIQGAFGTDTVAILLVSDDDNTLVIRAAVGLEEEVERKASVPVGRGVAGRIIQAERGMIVDDISDVEIASPVLKRHGIRSLMGVPLRLERRTIGVVHTGSTAPHAFANEDLLLLQLMGDRIAIAIDHARLYAEIQVRERDFRALSESVPEIIWTARPNGDLSRLNSRWYDYTGMPPGKAHDDILRAAVHPDDLDHSRKAWALAIETGTPYEIEQRLRGRDGEYHWFLSRAIPLKDESGAITRWLGTATDIEDLKRSIENLTTERALRESFVSTLSHDLRSPLTAAKASAQMILRYPDRDDSHPVLANRIIQSISRADRMITDLLDTNRIRAGQRIPVELDRRDLSAIARETIDELTTIHGDHFVLNGEPAIDAFTSGEGFRRILENLVGNAVKYGDLRRPVEITLRREADQVVLSVTNQGHAIRPEDQVRLFEPFTRSGGAERSGKKGWGIGLTLCRGIAEALGGSIGLRSVDGQGTTFTVRLPTDSRPSLAA